MEFRREPATWIVIAVMVLTVGGFLASRRSPDKTGRGTPAPAPLSDKAEIRTRVTRMADVERSSARTPVPAPRSFRPARQPSGISTATMVIDAESSRALEQHPYVTEDLVTLDDSYPVGTTFDSAASEFEVPVDLLKAVAYVESGGDHRHGMRTSRGTYGVMGLRETPAADTLAEAARLLGVDKTVLVRDPIQNVRGAAAVLREYRDQAVSASDTPRPWLTAVTLYCGLSAERGVDYAREIENHLREGLVHKTQSGQDLTIRAGQGELLSAPVTP